MKMNTLHNGKYDLKTTQFDVSASRPSKVLKYTLIGSMGLLMSALLYVTYQGIWHFSQKSAHEARYIENINLGKKLREFKERSANADRLMSQYEAQQSWLKTRHSAVSVLTSIFEAIPEEKSLKEASLKAYKDAAPWKLSLKFREKLDIDEIGILRKNLKGYQFEDKSSKKNREVVEGVLKHDV